LVEEVTAGGLMEVVTGGLTEGKEGMEDWVIED
jgi:hypothetical protein